MSILKTLGAFIALLVVYAIGYELVLGMFKADMDLIFNCKYSRKKRKCKNLFERILLLDLRTRVTRFHYCLFIVNMVSYATALILLVIYSATGDDNLRRCAIPPFCVWLLSEMIAGFSIPSLRSWNHNFPRKAYKRKHRLELQIARERREKQLRKSASKKNNERLGESAK